MATHPYPFQKEGVFKIRAFGGRALLADEMGLGKSAQALWYGRKFTSGLIVIVCPATIKENWRREAIKHVGMRASILEGREPDPGLLFGMADRGAMMGRVVILNYDILGDPNKQAFCWAEVINQANPELVVLDECQYVKSPEAGRSRGAKLLCRKVPKVLALSGTPLTNRPAELFNVLRLIRPDVFPSFRQFAYRYCDPQSKPWGMEFKGASNLDELHELLTSTCMIRRRKVDVLKDLPERQEMIVPLVLGKAEQEEYDEAENQFLVWLLKYFKSPKKVQKAMRAEKMTKMGYLRRLAGRLKLPQVQEWVSLTLENVPKLLMYGQHHKVLHPLRDHFASCAVLVDGGVTGRDRQNALDRFNTDAKVRVFVGNTIAAGTGWSCTSSSLVAFCELGWTPSEHDQAADRVRGIGRGLPGEPAQTYFLVAAGTIEEKLCHLLQTKKKVLDEVLDGKPSNELNVFDQLAMAYLDKGLRLKGAKA